MSCLLPVFAAAQLRRDAWLVACDLVPSECGCVSKRTSMHELTGKNEAREKMKAHKSMSSVRYLGVQMRKTDLLHSRLVTFSLTCLDTSGTNFS
jgi:hypothetical protein